MNYSDYECKLIDSMGTDLSIVNAARMALHNDTKPEDGKYNVEQKFLDKDSQLLKYLVSDQHTTPFEHCTATFMIKCPLFIARQIMEHRAFSFNEVDRRYTAANIEFWEPKRILLEPVSGRVDGEIDGDDADKIIETYKQFIDDAYAFYEQMITAGVAKEQARAVLPQSMHTSFYMTGNLINWIKFLKLIKAKDTQRELGSIAYSIRLKLCDLYPYSMCAWGLSGFGDYS